MDRALWITWYDLPEQGREAYLKWVHERYIPAVMRHPGVLWGAHYASLRKDDARAKPRDVVRKHNFSLEGVPQGNQYILMFGAENAHVFADPAPGALNAALPDEDRRMHAMRIGERMNVMVEAARVDGPDVKTYQGGMLPAPCIQLGSFNCAWQEEEGIMAWYAQSRMRSMGAVPGTVRTRNLASVAGWAKHGILYEYLSLELCKQHYLEFEAANPELKAWADRVTTTLAHATGAGGTFAQRIWPAAG
jgi:hypothetical protein